MVLSTIYVEALSFVSMIAVGTITLTLIVLGTVVTYFIVSYFDSVVISKHSFVTIVGTLSGIIQSRIKSRTSAIDYAQSSSIALFLYERASYCFCVSAAS